MQKIKINDEVIVLKGRSRGQTGKLQKINFKRQRVIITGINLIKKAIKPTKENPEGGVRQIEAPLHISNIAICSPKTQKGTRVRIETRANKKVRVAVSCGTILK